MEPLGLLLFMEFFYWDLLEVCLLFFSKALQREPVVGLGEAVSDQSPGDLKHKTNDDGDQNAHVEIIVGIHIFEVVNIDFPPFQEEYCL